MKRILLSLFLFLTFTANGKTVRVADYATPNDGLDDSGDFQLAINNLRNGGGGTLEIGNGTWFLKDGLNLTSATNYVSYLIKGDKGAIIQVDAGQSANIFYAGNVNQLELKDLVFIGSGETYDVGRIALTNFTEKVKVSGCQFYGIRAKEEMFWLGNVDAEFEHTQFAGSTGDNAVIYGYENLKSLTVDNVNFVDFGNFGINYYSKVGASAWIKVEGLASQPTNFNAPSVTVNRSRFDEGATRAVWIKNIPDVAITNIAVNVSGITDGAGVIFDNVPYGIIEGSTFGYTANVRPAVRLLNNSNARVSRLKFGGGVYFADIDGTSAARVSYCPMC